MISSLRNFAKTKFAGLLVFIMIIPFVFWGMGGMFSSGNTNNIAKINDNSISTEDFIDYVNKSGIPEKTIRENLNYSQPDVISLEEELASIGVLDWFDRYEKKLDQEVGERGGNISAGERQFVALLRAVLAKRKIIVFDEATANLDIESESSILDATEKLLTFQTSIVIAHRLETVLNAEKIIVMENGNLTGFDSHENLLKDNQTYKDLFSAWNLVNES